MDHLGQLAAEVVRLFHLKELLLSTERALVLLGSLFVLIYVLEDRFAPNPDKKKYLSRNFFNDVVYSLFYSGGLYSFLFTAALFSMLRPRLKIFDFHLLHALPWPAAYLVGWLAADFLGYWIHRFQHTNRYLWAFHSVHHADERLTFLASFRNHIGDQFIANLVMLVPLLILGMPERTWVPIYILQCVLEGMQHSELNWSFGHAYYLLVSPRFHAFHHSRSQEHYNRNFGKILSLWDRWFGTFVPPSEQPLRYGIEGVRIPESLWQQFIVPFKVIWGRLREKAGGLLVAETR